MTKQDDEKKERRKHGAIFWFILTLITGAITICAISAAVILGEYGLYDSTGMFRNNINERLLKNYAVYALSDYTDDFRLEQLEKTNFRYGVYSTDDPSGVNLERESSYLVCTLPEDVLAGDKTELFKYSATLGEYSVFQYDIDNLPGAGAYVTNWGNYNDSNVIIEQHQISGFLYAWNTDMAYVLTEDNYYFPVSLCWDMSELYQIYRGQEFDLYNEDRTDWSEELIEHCNMYICTDDGDYVDIYPSDVIVCK